MYTNSALLLYSRDQRSKTSLDDRSDVIYHKYKDCSNETYLLCDAAIAVLYCRKYFHTMT